MSEFPKLKVMKRDGREEEFIPEKLVVSLLKVNVPLNLARIIAKIIECRIYERGGKAGTWEIAKWVLEILERENKEWYDKWVEYNLKVKGRDIVKELEQYIYPEVTITP